MLRGAGEPAAVTSRNGRSVVVSLETGRVLLDAVRVRNSVLARRPDGSFLRVGRKDDDSSRAPLYIFDAQGNADAGFALYPHECESFDVPADGRWVAASCKEGSIVVWSIETHTIALVLRPFPGLDSGYALEPTTGKVEIFGHPPLAPICRAGARSLPFEACDDVVEPGLVARVLGFPQ